MSRVDVDRLRLEPQQRRLSNGYARWLLALLILLGAGGAFLHDRWSPDDSNLKSRPNNVLLASEPPAPLAPVEEERVVVAGGFLEARRDATLSPGRDGVVAAVHVKPGQKVRMGELLLELVARTSRAELAAAEAELAIASARLALAKAGARAEEKQRAQARSAAAEAEWQEKKSQLARSRRLSERQVLSESEFESAERDERVARARLAEARATERIVQLGSRDEELQLAAAEVEKAKAGVQRAQARLDLSLLRAPFDATVVRIDLEPGEVVNTIDSPYAQTGIEIADVSELWARLDVPETRIGWVRLGAPAEVVVEACGPDALAAEVIEIAPVADRESNTVSVAVRILEPPALIRPNMSARVTIREEKPK